MKITNLPLLICEFLKRNTKTILDPLGKETVSGAGLHPAGSIMSKLIS